MNNLIIKYDVEVEDMIYEIKGKYVMLDSDLAKLYNVETKRINKSVNRNKEKFPERFSWILNKEDELNLRSQFATSSWNNNYGGRRYKIRVFTEQGVAMLVTILKSKVAVETSIKIMDAFVSMRKYISTTLLEQKYVNELVFKDHEKIKLLENSFKKLEEKKKSNEIYFDGGIMMHILRY